MCANLPEAVSTRRARSFASSTWKSWAWSVLVSCLDFLHGLNLSWESTESHPNRMLIDIDFMAVYVHSDIPVAIRKFSLERWPWLWSGWLSHSVWRLEETRCLASLKRLKVWTVLALSQMDQGRNGFGWLTVSESGVTIASTADHQCEVMLLDDRTLEFHSQYGRHHRLRVPKCGGPRYPAPSKTISAHFCKLFQSSESGGRSLSYDSESCNLFVGGSSSSLYRQNVHDCPVAPSVQSTSQDFLLYKLAWLTLLVTVEA